MTGYIRVRFEVLCSFEESTSEEALRVHHLPLQSIQVYFYIHKQFCTFLFQPNIASWVV